MPTQQDDDAASLLHLCLYEPQESDRSSEHHVDFGLLSVVVESAPGLEVWDGEQWLGSGRGTSGPDKTEAVMMVGRQLHRLSNGRYPACWHRVVSYGVKEAAGAVGNSVTRPMAVSCCEGATPGKQRRLSIMFSLRAHAEIVNSAKLETNITGTWDLPLEGVRAGDMFGQDRGFCRAMKGG
ncbi:hypothetical protein EJ07DRAFT_151071 [Lizonia empirigonia]|nr:hypothetical protein EJ07DRAFT_151071 [Lizonia empirigonia]